MRRYTVALLALAATLAIAPTAFGDTFSFHFASPGETAIGTLIGSQMGSTGDYQITSGTISITGSAFSGTGVIDTNPSDLGPFGADNVLYFIGNGPNGRYLDTGGLLFSTTNGLNNLWGGDNNGYGTSYSLSGNNGNYISYPGTFRVSAPDGGMTLMLLGGALVGLATLRRKFRV